jgi:hypothetical protein
VAIFGNLREMPLADLLGMLGRRSGVLEVFHLPGKRSGYALALDSGKAVWLREGNRFLDPVEARAALRDLCFAQEGAFEFSPGTPPSPPEGKALGWPLERFLLSMTTVEDEIAALRPALPDPKTRFQVVEGEPIWDEPLASFWQAALPLLRQGASAEEIAGRLGYRPEEAAYYLHKLRLLGKVAPVRAYRESTPTEERKGLVQRLLAALMGRRG